MNIFLDTNIFFNDWFLRGAGLRYLFHYINNEGHTLLLSELVIEEVENKYKRSAVEVFKKAEKSVVELNKYDASSSISLPEIGSIGVEQYDLRLLLDDRVDDIRIVKYDGIAQSAVVRRALDVRRPFLGEEKGYRDTLIWLSLLADLRSFSDCRMTAFITQNSTDFFLATSDTPAFHPDLVEDIKSAGLLGELIPYRSLLSFIDKNVDKSVHRIDRARLGRDSKDYLEEAASDFLLARSPEVVEELREYLGLPSVLIAEVHGFSVEMVEGIEDFCVLNTAEIQGSDVYVESDFNLRIIDINLYVRDQLFSMNEGVISDAQARGAIYEVERIQGYALLKCLLRAYFSASFVYNVGAGCSGFQVSSLSFGRKKGSYRSK